MTRTASGALATPSFVISTSDFGLTSSSWQALAETAAADSATRPKPETEEEQDDP